MKKTQVSELLANIKKTFVSFFSILMFAALGVGIFLGISWAGPALERAANNMLDEGSFHSFQIQFPYGLTDDDLKELSEIEGVTQVEAAHQSFQTLVVDGDRKAAVKVQTLGRDIDTSLLVEGELPAKAGEMAFHAPSAAVLGVSVGDTVTFVKDADEGGGVNALSSDDAAAEESSNKSGMKYLTSQSFKVTALINSPDYLADSDATYGIAPTPSGVVGGLAWVPDSSFDESAFLNGRPIVNVRCDELMGLDTFSDDYKARSKEVELRIAALGDGLATARYDDLHGQAQKKIDDGEAQLADARRRIVEGEQAIEDGTRQLEEGRALLEQKRAEGEAALAAAYQQLMYYEALKAEGEQKLAQAREMLSMGREAIEGSDVWDEVKGKQVELDGETITIGKGRGSLDNLEELAAEAEAEYNDKVAELNNGWSLYYEGRRTLEEETAKAERELADGEAQIEDAKRQVEDGKTQVAEGEKKLEDAKAELAKMAKYSWTLLPRSYNPGVGEVSTFSGVTDNLSISMAALFIIVGLLVSYFAVSRIVREQVTQVGTKKALGFRRGEITTSYLWYSGLAVLVGAIVGAIVGFLVVEGIIGSVLGSLFVFGAYPAYFGWGLFLVVTLIYLALVLAATYLACRGILKEHAVELLKGPKPPTGKTRFYEKWGIWDKLPLLIQTIVNNCVNDKRRVLSTIVGVAGATALIVTAITLNNDVLKSYDRHYEDVYGFNAITYVESTPDKAIDDVETALQGQGAETAQVFMKTFMIEQPNGESGALHVISPEDAAAFAQLYHVNPVAGSEFDPSAEGVWVSQAYAEHFGAKAGDMLLIDDGVGAKHEVPILGFYEFWLTYHEAVMGHDYFEKEFGSADSNAVLADTGDVAVSDVESALKKVEGFDSIIDDATNQYANFDMFSKVSGAVVAIYLALAVLMAIVVLLNLNVMFIEEKKRELIVLMINGFSVKDARHYISYDNVVLTALGIIAGLILGCIMGSITVVAIEPSTGVFVKNPDIWAIVIGILGSAILSIIMSLIALRRVNNFNLTDINRF